MEKVFANIIVDDDGKPDYKLKFVDIEFEIDEDYYIDSDGRHYHKSTIFDNEIEARSSLWHRFDDRSRYISAMKEVVLYAQGEYDGGTVVNVEQSDD